MVKVLLFPMKNQKFNKGIILTALGSEIGLSYSNRDYEDSVYRLAASPSKSALESSSSSNLKENEVESNNDTNSIYDNTKPDGQYRKDIDSSKLLSVLKGFEFTSLEEGIGRVYDNFSKRYN